MIDVEDRMHDQITHDLDCSENALQLLSLRKEMKRLIADWSAAGGAELLPDIRERVRAGVGARTGPRPVRAAARR